MNLLPTGNHYRIPHPNRTLPEMTAWQIRKLIREYGELELLFDTIEDNEALINAGWRMYQIAELLKEAKVSQYGKRMYKEKIQSIIDKHLS